MAPVTALHTVLRDRAAGLLVEGTSVDVRGMPGSGRSALVSAIADELADTGRRVLRVRGVAALRARPLEPLAVAGLIDRRQAQASTPVAAATGAVLEAVRGGRTAVVVDDADDLDDASAGVLAAVHGEHGYPLLTVTAPRPGRARGSLPAAVQPGVVLEMPALGYVEMQSLLAGVLDGPWHGTLVARILTASGGLPGLALAIVDGARRAGSLVRTDGSWTPASDIWSPDLLRSLDPLLEGLSPEALDGLHALALAGGVDVGTARKVAGWPALDELDGHGLLRFVPRGEEILVGVYPPVLAERFRRPALGARHLRVSEHVAVALGGTSPPPGHLLPLPFPSPWPGDDEPVEGSVAASDAVVSRMLVEHWNRETLVRRSVWDDTPSPGNAVAYLRALLVTGADSATVREVIDATVRTGERRAIVELDAWGALAVGLGERDLAGALAILDRSREEAADWSPLLSAVATHLTLLVSRAPRLAAAPLPARGTEPVVARAQVAARAEVLAARGRPTEALALLGVPEETDEPFSRTRMVTYGLALFLDGRLDEAFEWSTRHLRDSRSRGDIDQMTAHAYIAASVLRMQLRLSELRALLTSVLSTGLYSALQRPAEAGLLSMASSLALYDDRPAAARTLAEQARALGAGPSWYPLTTPTNPLAHLEGAGLPADEARHLAADRMWTEFEQLRDRGLLAAAIVVGVRSVAEDPDPGRLAALGRVTATVPARLARHAETYAEALASDDPAGTLAAAATLADAGLVLLAVGAYSRPLRALRASGDAVGAARALEEARERLAAFGPDAVAALDAETAANLSERELEVARLAAAGGSNQAIADRLGLSVRTVENHLHSVFRKTGALHRADLARLRTL